MAGSLGQGRLLDRDAGQDLGWASGGAGSMRHRHRYSVLVGGKFGWKCAGFAAGYNASSGFGTSTTKKRIE